MDYSEFIETGKNAIVKRDFRQAKKILTSAIARDILKPAAYNLLGVIFEYEGDLKRAKKMYRASLAVDSSYSPAIENLDRSCQWQYSTKGINLG